MTHHFAKRFVTLAFATTVAVVAPSCGSDDETSSTGATEATDATPAATDSTSVAADSDAPEPAEADQAGFDVTCEVGDVADDTVSIFFTSSESVPTDYYVRVAEPDGSNDSLIKLDAVAAGQVVAQSFDIIGPPSPCTVVDVETEVSQLSGDEDVTCEVIPMSGSAPDALVTIVNSGDDAARYDLVIAFFNSSGERIRQQISGIDELAPGESITRDLLTPVEFAADDTCAVAASTRREPF